MAHTGFRCRRGRCLGLGAALVMLGLLTGLAWLGLRLVPLPEGLRAPPPAPNLFVDRHGQPLRAQPAGEQYGRRLAYEQLPRALVEATLAAEDKRFWQHRGVDWRASARAAGQYLRHGRVVSGGSTLTQQLIKLAHPRPRTLRTKAIEAAQAARLEQVWDKPRILTEYLNRLDYGNLCRGPAEAAAFYFGKPPGDLSTAEAAFLAGLPQGPSRLDPLRHLDRATRRRQWVLDRMLETGMLTPSEHAQASNEPVRLQARSRVFAAPHFVDLLLARGGQRLLAPPGHPVRTTLDLELNRTVERLVQEQLRVLRDHHARNGAVVVLDNPSGDVLALVGSEDYFSVRAGQVNGAWAPRSAGSTFKPFTYLLAFERGATPASVAADIPSEYPTPTGVFRPVNYDRRFRGPVRYRLALANSLNVPAVRILADVGGPQALIDRLEACGLTTLDRNAEHYGLGLTIGNAEARLLELAGAYAALARLGEYKPCRLLLNPPPEFSSAAASRRIGDAGAAWLVADILADNAARALAFGVDSPLRFDFPVACKTGTSSDFRDNWAFGYTPEFTVGVWVGNFDGSPMRQVSGVTGAAPILHGVFAQLHARYGTTWYTPPPGLQTFAVHPVTGHRLTAPRANGVFEKFLAHCLPPEESAGDYAPTGRVLLPSEYRQWAESAASPFDLLAVADTPRVGRTFEWISPLPGTTYFLDPDLPETSTWLELRAEGGPGIEWASPTLELVEDSAGPRARLVEGRHELVAEMRATGERRSTWIRVKRR